MAEFLLEILSEEIPARLQRRGAASLRDLLVERLAGHGIGEVSSLTCAAPRRIVVVLRNLPARQPDFTEERKGPRVGAPDKAVEGFARSAGVAAQELERRDTAKGAVWFAVIPRTGRPVAEILAEVVPAAMSALVWPRSMRWGGHDVRWVRPVSSIVAMFGGTTVPFRWGPLESGATTRGHRFLSPQSIAVTGFDDYRKRLRAANVMVDRDERSTVIAEGSAALAAAQGCVPAGSAGLVDELTGLVEWPVPMIGEFDPAFMALPEEVLTSAMTRHQRYIPLRDAGGALAPRFVFVANTAGRDGGATIVAGNERVLAARLSDARYFWNRDRMRTMESRVPDLAGMVFHAGLGNMFGHAERIKRLAGNVATMIPGCDVVLACRAAHLAKADLTTQMVGEFPDLQGVMGGHYARHDGEDEAVATAIAEHYRPRGPSDSCPSAPTSVAVALAGKLDMLVGFFAVGERPTGSRDPFALRRAAYGVIRLVLENGLRLPLLDAFAAALDAYGPEVSARVGESAGDELLDFFADRLKVHLLGEEIGHDLIDAAFLRARDDDLVRLKARAMALHRFLETDNGASLLAAYRRAASIVRIEGRKDGTGFDGDVRRDLLVDAQELAVADALATAAATARPALDAERFEAAMAALAALREPVDLFFDGVTVNVGDRDLRINRLHLLSAIRSTIDQVADFSRIEGRA